MFQNLLVVDALRVETSSAVLLEGVAFSITPGDRAAITGRNGAGKSTLLQLLAAAAGVAAGPDHASWSGTITLDASARTGYLTQTPQASPGETVARALAAASRGAARAWEDYVACLRLLETDSSEGALAEYSRTLDAVTALDAWDYTGRAEQLLEVLLPGVELTRSMGSLSGGQATLVVIAGLLLGGVNLLLLDEPTNNLDDAAVDRLASVLADAQAGVVMVSHDRAFLDEAAGQILEIDEFDHSLHHHHGNYSAYLQQREVHLEAAQRSYEEQVRLRAKLEADAARIAQAAQGFDSRSSNDYFRARGAKLARRAVVQNSRIDRQLSRLEQPRRPQRPRLEVVQPPRRRGTMLRTHGLAAGHGCDVLSGVDLSLHAGERVMVLGGNGSGKSTLLHTLGGHTPPRGGDIWRDPDCEVGLLAQTPTVPRGIGCIDWVRQLAPVSADEAGALLGRVLFGDLSRRSTDRLSIGELRRIELAVLFQRGLPLVLLDEPSNHLDLLTQEMLDEALGEFRGTLVVVSHDRRLLERFQATQMWQVGAGRVNVLGATVG